MKLISLKCPSCGAKLEVNGDLDKYTCNFCGVTTLLDDESITVKHVGSKLQTEINTVKDYYDNGNYKKALSLSEALLNEYPTNKELKKLYDNSELIIAESFAKEVLENEYKVKTVKGYYVLTEIEEDLNKLKEYKDTIKKNKTIDDAYKKLDELYKKYKEENDIYRRGSNKLIIGIVVIPLVLFLLFIISFYISLKVENDKYKKGNTGYSNNNTTSINTTATNQRLLVCLINNGNETKKYSIYYTENAITKLMYTVTTTTESESDAKYEYNRFLNTTYKYKDYKGLNISASYFNNIVVTSMFFTVNEMDSNAQSMYNENFNDIKDLTPIIAKNNLESSGYSCDFV